MQPLGKRPARRVRGLSLIELMVALLLGTLLMLGLVQVFSASRTASQLSEGIARVQENGRFAMDFLQRDIRMAGHFGCINDQAHLQNGLGTFNQLFAANRTTAAYNAIAQGPLGFHVSIRGHEYTGTGPADTIALPANPAVDGTAGNWSPALPAELAGRVLQGSDVVVLRYLVPDGVPVTAFTIGTPTTVSYNPANEAILMGSAANPGLFGVSDCINVAIFQASAVSAGQVQIPAIPQGVNQSGFAGTQQFGIGQSTIHRAESSAFYVGLNAEGEPALFRLRFNAAPGAGAVTATPEELVEGVESMQLLYGVDNNALGTLPSGFMQNLLGAQQIGGNDELWRRVGAVQVGLLMRSPIRTSSGDPEVDLRVLGTTFTPPGDGRLRTGHENHIALRNRLFGN